MRESRKATTPRSSARRISRPAPWDEAQRGVGGRHGHEAVAAHPGDGLRARRRQRVVGARERDAVDDDELAGRAGHVDALPQREGAEQAGLRVARELPHQRGDLVLALAEEADVALLVGEPLAHRLGGLLGRAHRGEQPEGATAGRPDQRLDLVEGLLAEPVAAGRRKVLGDIGDGLLRVVERAADVEPAPLRGALAAQPHRARDGVERAAELERRRGHDDGAVTEDLVAQQHRDAHRRHAQHRAAARVAADPHDVEVALLEDAGGVLEDLVDGRLGHLAGAVGLDALLGLELGTAPAASCPSPARARATASRVCR